MAVVKTKEVACTCGASYEIPEELFGLVFECQDCERKLIANEIPGINELDEEGQQRMLAEIAESQQATQSRASNPGMLNISKLKYVMAYPKWALVWHGGLLASIGLCFVSLWFIPLVLFFLWACRIYWSRAIGRFQSGCSNPSRIVSLDPPLVAVYTDLRHGPDSKCPVIKIMEMPINRMVDGAPQQGKNVVSVAFYDRGPDVLDHWSDFQPSLANAVAKDAQSIERMLASFDDEDWQELDNGLSQVPKPYRPGLYRILDAEHVDHVRQRQSIDEGEVIHLMKLYLDDVRNIEFYESKIVPHEVFDYVPQETRKEVLAVMESAAVSSDKTEGFALTPSMVFGHFNEIGKFQFSWSDVTGALASNSNLTITLKDSTRIEVPKKHYLPDAGAAFDMLFTAVSHL